MINRLLSLLGITACALILPQQFVNGAAPSGAIFTTDAGGTFVNANVQYNSKCDVYLDGGPGPNAPAHAAGLPAGDYFFQVTDPNGQALLSTDAVSNRRFTVSANGVITAFTGIGGPVHPTGIDQDHPELGAITIRIANLSCPTDYLDSPNNGGVYKVWATRVSDFSGDPARVDNPCGGGCFHGFLSSKSKTDNFKVRPTTSTFCVTLAKLLLNSDGSFSPGVAWEMHIADVLGVSNTYFTDSTGQVKVCDLAAGTYTASEVMQSGWAILGLIVNGTTIPAQPLYSFTWSAGSPEPIITFQNQTVTPPE